jgi:hypothetical protein
MSFDAVKTAVENIFCFGVPGVTIFSMPTHSWYPLVSWIYFLGSLIVGVFSGLAAGAYLDKIKTNGKWTGLNGKVKLFLGLKSP